MKTLITGAAGFVGSAVLRQLIAVGHSVRALVRPGSDRRNLSGLPVEIALGGLTDRPSLNRRNMTLKEILCELAAVTGRKPPRFCLSHNLVFPVACMAELWTRMTGGREPRVTLDGVRLAKKRMFFSAEKAGRVLGFHPRPVEEAFHEAVDWFRRHGYVP